MKGRYFDSIVEIINDLNDDQKIAVHNEYCSESDNLNDYIYSMNEFDEIMSGMTPWEVARAAFYGDFCPVHDYFWFNGYGNLESSDFCPDVICPDDIADYMIREDDDLGLHVVRKILDEMQEENVR